jgi:hypothetical protein
MIRRLVLSLFLLAGVVACPPAAAQAQSLVRLSIVDRDTGAELTQYPDRGQRWIAGAPGHRYAVRLSNLGGERVLVVLSVDGVNAVSGETAAASQGGYVLDPWETADIAGWRKSLDDVAAFVFTDLGESYAARTGRPDNVGVIGIAVFRERAPAWRRPPPVAIARAPAHSASSRAARETANAAPAPSAQARAADASTQVLGTQVLGTGHGEREFAPVATTGFVRASRMPAQIYELRYDTARRLAALGILPRHRPARAPRAFPGGFVPDPPAG